MKIAKEPLFETQKHFKNKHWKLMSIAIPRKQGLFDSHQIIIWHFPFPCHFSPIPNVVIDFIFFFSRAFQFIIWNKSNRRQNIFQFLTFLHVQHQCWAHFLLPCRLILDACLLFLFLAPLFLYLFIFFVIIAVTVLSRYLYAIDSDENQISYNIGSQTIEKGIRSKEHSIS